MCPQRRGRDGGSTRWRCGAGPAAGRPHPGCRGPGRGPGHAVPAVAGGAGGAEPDGEPGVQPVPVRRQLLRPVRRAVHRAARDTAAQRGHRGGPRRALDRPAVARPGAVLRRLGGRRVPGRGGTVLGCPHIRLRRAGAGDAQPRRPAGPRVPMDLRRRHRLPGQHPHPGAELRLPAVRADVVAGRGGQPGAQAAGQDLAGPPGARAVGEHTRLGADRGGDGRPVRGLPGRRGGAATGGPAGGPRLPRARRRPAQGACCARRTAPR